MWARILQAFDHRCAYCGVKPDVICREHMMPSSRGGEDELENIVPSCRQCNSAKGLLTPMEWIFQQAGLLRRTTKAFGYIQPLDPWVPRQGYIVERKVITHRTPVWVYDQHQRSKWLSIRFENGEEVECAPWHVELDPPPAPRVAESDVA